MDEHGRLYGPFNTLLHFPVEGAAVSRRGEEIRFGTRLSDQQRELVILFLAKRLNAPYEWYAHVRIAEKLGVAQGDLEWLRNLRPGREEIVGEGSYSTSRLIGCCEELLSNNRLSPASVDYLEDLFSGASLQLVALVGYYQDLGRILGTFGYRIPDADIPALASEFEEYSASE